MNGFRDYAIRNAGESNPPGRYDGKRGCRERWYRRIFTVPESWVGSRVLRYFGAVDWKAEIRVNGMAAAHTGCYYPFTVFTTTRIAVTVIR